jgi:hypothetical protein
LPSLGELKKKKWCKWHSTSLHHTNECKVFKQQIQLAIEQGLTKFDDQKKLVEIDGRSFLVSMRGGLVALIKRHQKNGKGEIELIMGSILIHIGNVHSSSTVEIKA